MPNPNQVLRPRGRLANQVRVEAVLGLPRVHRCATAPRLSRGRCSEPCANPSYSVLYRSMIRLLTTGVWSCSMISFPSFMFPVQYILLPILP